MTLTASDILDSETAFLNQFDRRHPSYHNGDIRPVPIGGTRLPEGCDENDSQELNSTLELSPEYNIVSSERDLIGQLKAKILSCSKLVGTVVQRGTNDKKSTDNPQIKVDEELENIRNLLTLYIKSTDSNYKEDVKNIVESSILLLSIIPSSKEDYGSFILEIQKCLRQLFAVQGKLLQKLKKIKASTS